MSQIRLEIQGEPGTISLRSLGKAVDNWLGMLTDLDAAISREPRATLEWVIRDLRTNSVVLIAESHSRMEDRNVGPEVASAFVQGMAQVERHGTSPPYLSQQGMESARRLLKMIGRDGAAGLVVANARQEVELSALASLQIDQLLQPGHQAIGSVEGRIETISIRRGQRFVVYQHRTQKAVSCRFEGDEWLERAKELLGHRVIVAGTVHHNARGEPTRVDLTDIRRIRSRDQLPRTSDIKGLMPDLTGGASSEDYVRSLRRA